jgi:uncharacterized membrane protein (UPF0136 family)
MTNAQIVILVYIALLLVGGIMGFVKAGSKASLIASTISAAVLALFVFNVLPFIYHWIVLVLLLALFAVRWGKKGKFMPNGFMVLITILALIAPMILARI